MIVETRPCVGYIDFTFAQWVSPQDFLLLQLVSDRQGEPHGVVALNHHPASLDTLLILVFGNTKLGTKKEVRTRSKESPFALHY